MHIWELKTKGCLIFFLSKRAVPLSFLWTGKDTKYVSAFFN